MAKAQMSRTGLQLLPLVSGGMVLLVVGLWDG